jgi:hypothetical protein
MRKEREKRNLRNRARAQVFIGNSGRGLIARNPKVGQAQNLDELAKILDPRSGPRGSNNRGVPAHCTFALCSFSLLPGAPSVVLIYPNPKSATDCDAWESYAPNACRHMHVWGGVEPLPEYYARGSSILTALCDRLNYLLST